MPPLAAAEQARARERVLAGLLVHLVAQAVGGRGFFREEIELAAEARCGDSQKPHAGSLVDVFEERPGGAEDRVGRVGALGQRLPVGARVEGLVAILERDRSWAQPLLP